MIKRALGGFLVAAFVLGSAMFCMAGMESEHYRIPRSVQSGGGAFMVSGSYAAWGTLEEGEIERAKEYGREFAIKLKKGGAVR